SMLSRELLAGWEGHGAGRATASGPGNHTRGCPGLVAIRGRVPALAHLAGRVRPGLCPATAHQSTGRSTWRGRGGSPQSDETRRGQDDVLQGPEPWTRGFVRQARPVSRPSETVRHFE